MCCVCKVVKCILCEWMNVCVKCVNECVCSVNVCVRWLNVCVYCVNACPRLENDCLPLISRNVMFFSGTGTKYNFVIWCSSNSSTLRIPLPVVSVILLFKSPKPLYSIYVKDNKHRNINLRRIKSDFFLNISIERK